MIDPCKKIIICSLKSQRSFFYKFIASDSGNSSCRSCLEGLPMQEFFYQRVLKPTFFQSSYRQGHSVHQGLVPLPITGIFHSPLKTPHPRCWKCQFLPLLFFSLDWWNFLREDVFLMRELYLFEKPLSEKISSVKGKSPWGWGIQIVNI